MKTILCGALVASALACARAETAPGDQAAPQSKDAVVAEVAGRTITLEELDSRWQETDPAERARVSQLLYQDRRNVLDQMVGDLLIEEGARAAGLATRDYLEQETSRRLQPVTESDIVAFFEANKDRAQGGTLDTLRQPIHAFLTGQRRQQARARLVDELKKESTARVLLEPPRQAVEILPDDPALGPASAPVTLIEFSDYQ
jgi:hypothetical protein